jgi:hypothetical protein
MSIEFIYGTQTKLELISQTHGAVKVPLAQNFDYTPAFDERRLFEFDRADAVAIVTNFNGVEIRFDHFDSISKLVDAMVNDVDPAATAIVDDPSQYKDLNIMLNIRSKTTNLIFQSVLAKNVRLSGAAATEPVREEAAIARSGSATNVLRLKGVALEYNRLLRDGSAAFAQGSANSHADKEVTLADDLYSVDLDHVVQIVSASDPNLDGKSIIYVLKNGSEYIGATVTTADSTSTIHIPEDDFGEDDVFETFTAYIDA